ncbi:serine/threonine-protein kinase pim-2 [Pimephales promelas]|nr:serine/threonine-protein kinase pim-2 [Pimephales promelas]
MAGSDLYSMTSVQSLNTDKNTCRTVTTGKKRKQSSHPDEGPARKRPRMNSVEVASAPSSYDPKGSSDQGQDETAVPIYERHAKEFYQNVVADFSGLEVQPPANPPDILSRYQFGRILGKGGFGIVYEGKRLEDGLEVAVKIARKPRKMQYISIPGHPAPLPLEVALLILVNNREPKVTQIIQLLDWQDELDYYIMVLERPLPCTDLLNFISLFRGTLSEFGAQLVMWQVTHAANACSASGVLHRDIKMENILINPETLETKLIDFGCGDLLKKSAYNYFSGTREYRPPEFKTEGRMPSSDSVSPAAGPKLTDWFGGNPVPFMVSVTEPMIRRGHPTYPGWMLGPDPYGIAARREVCVCGATRTRFRRRAEGVCGGVSASGTQSLLFAGDGRGA